MAETTATLSIGWMARPPGGGPALITAISISIISMEGAMNLTDYLLTGGAILTWLAVSIMLLAGYVSPLPYNWWRLIALGKACCG